MCLGGNPLKTLSLGLLGGSLGGQAETPAATAAVDPAIERAKAETEAALAANSKLAAKNRSRAASALQKRPLDSATSEVQALGAAPGKTVLGQ